MPDMSEFDRLARPKAKRHCAVDRAMIALADTEAEQLEAAIAGEYGTPVIKKWCKLRGLEVSDAAVRVHREGNCSCSHE